MPEYGISVIPYWDSLDRTRELVRAADDGGLQLRAGNERIAAAAVAGRDPRRIRRVLNLQGVIGESRTPPAGELPVGYLLGDPLAGPPEWWAETLTRFIDDGFDTLVFWPVDPSPGQVEAFACEVVPLLPGDDTDRRGGAN